MDPTNQRQPLPPLPSIILFMMMQQLLEFQANTIPWRGSYYDLPVCVGPVYQGMLQQHQHQYRAPSSGPNRNQRSKGFRKAETHNLNKIVHESSGIIAGDYSTGIYPGNARIGVNDNTGACKVWRTPPRNSLMADHNSTQQMRTKPYNRDRSSRPQKKVRTDKVNTSAYEIPIMRTKSTLISLSILNRPFHQHPTTLCRRRKGKCSKDSNTGTSHAANMVDCTYPVDTCTGCINVDSMHRDY